MSFKDFSNTIRKSIGKRKSSQSYGLKDAFHYYMDNSKYGLTRVEFMKVITTMNDLAKEELLKGGSFSFPLKMGTIELRKTIRTPKIVNGKVKVTYPIDWSSTLKLWYEDPKAKEAKTLVRIESPIVYQFFYKKERADYHNRMFYRFNVSRGLKQKLKDNINNGVIIDAYPIN